MAIADRVAVMNRGRIEQIAAPAELYEEPATRFSASFVGNRNAIVLPVHQGCVRLGNALSASAPVPNGRDAVVFFRPEDVCISSNGKGHPALVETKMFQGVLTRLQLLVEDERLQARINADIPSREAASLEPGMIIRIVIPEEAVRVFTLDE
jgi:putative spermidine/putrescine transport system ATP-binding protein